MISITINLLFLIYVDQIEVTCFPGTPTRLQLSAKPLKVESNKWLCSQDCRPKKQSSHFVDSQAVEKHILRYHPDPIYNAFVCLVCEKVKTSPQQILDHLGQLVKNGGHAIKGQTEKNEFIRAVHKDTQNQFRVFRDKAVFAWYICEPPLQCPRYSEPSSSLGTMPSMQENQPEAIIVIIQEICSKHMGLIKVDNQQEQIQQPHHQPSEAQATTVENLHKDHRIKSQPAIKREGDNLKLMDGVCTQDSAPGKKQRLQFPNNSEYQNLSDNREKPMPNQSSGQLDSVLSEIGQAKNRQDSLNKNLNAIQEENECLWGEVLSLRQKHNQQQKMTNKLIEFLVVLVEPTEKKS